MKKTVSVNIKGLNFLIEEDAYESLQHYIDRLTISLKNQEGTTEIIEDIELRIAEICNSKLNENKTVIELKDIEDILENLGDPADYVDEDDSQNEKSSFSEGNRSEKRLFRDTEHATIAGVCAGLANYIGIDVVIIRAIFVIMFFFGGFSIPLYIILWIIVPETRNTIDRLRMKGRPITVETVRDEVELAASRIKDGSTKIARKFSRKEHYKTNVNRGVRIISTLFGLSFIAAGLLLFVLFFVFVIGRFEFIPIQSETGFLSLTEFGELLLSDASDIYWAWVAGIMLSGSVILFLVVLGVRILIRVKNRLTQISLLVLFIIGFSGGLIGIYLGMKTGRDFVMEGELEKEVGAISTNQLVIISQLPALTDHESYKVKSENQYGLLSVTKEKIKENGIRFKYKRSPDSLFHVKQILSSRAYSHNKALNKSQNIKHKANLSGDTLTVNTTYSFPREDKFRDQGVLIIIEIPEGGKLKFNQQVIFPNDTFNNRSIQGEYLDVSGELESDGTYHQWNNR